VSLNPSATPKLLSEDKPTSGSPAHTIYLEINLEFPKGREADPMTAVFAPDPSQLTAPEVNVLVWLHGDKAVWSKHRKGTKDMSGTTVQDYLQVQETMLRDFILASSKRKFVLVVPTLSDRTGTGDAPGGLLWKQDQFEAFLQQALNGVKAYMKKATTDVKNLIVAAHSGGGHIQGHIADTFGGMFDKKLKELWCFDCTYWGGLKGWVKSHHSDCRLWAYSTGEARTFKLVDPKKKEAPDNPRNVPARSGTGDTAAALLELARQLPASATTVDVFVESFAGNLQPTDSTPNFVAKFGMPDGKRHYESIETCFTKVLDSTNKTFAF